MVRPWSGQIVPEDPAYSGDNEGLLSTPNESLVTGGLAATRIHGSRFARMLGALKVNAVDFYRFYVTVGKGNK